MLPKMGEKKREKKIYPPHDVPVEIEPNKSKASWTKAVRPNLDAAVYQRVGFNPKTGATMYHRSGPECSSHLVVDPKVMGCPGQLRPQSSGYLTVGDENIAGLRRITV